jgi:hypothetical protein
MYGLVNKAIQDMICHQFGHDTWQTIKKKAGVELDAFISLDSYPDEVTYSLAQAASQVLGISLAEVLEAFGEYWVLYTKRGGYGEMFRWWGDDLRSFLLNLNNMHTRIALFFPHLKPPTFECTDLGDNSLVLHYHSERRGLAPIVIGMLKGLGTVFQTPIEVTQIAHREQGAAHDQFLVRFGA